MSLNETIKNEAERAAKALDLSPRFIAAWWIAENGWTWPSTNNPGNISYAGDGVPKGGEFAGAVRVDPNNVVEYDTPAEGVDAFCLLLKTPKGPNKALTIDLTGLHACGDDVHKMCYTVGASNWAASHYEHGDKGPGSLIWDVYAEKALEDAFGGDKTPNPNQGGKDLGSDAGKTRPATRGPRRREYTIKRGDTLSHIALDFGCTVRSLQYLNDIKDANVIDAGAKLELPFEHKVKPGDTVSELAVRYDNTVHKIALMNDINPDLIVVGWTLYV